METKTTQRGFKKGEFTDGYNNKCSLQESSSAENYYIWLGIDNPKVTIFDSANPGTYVKTEVPNNWMIEGRMHLSRRQVAELLPSLQHFVATGELL